jgi:hypothetical protein
MVNQPDSDIEVSDPEVFPVGSEIRLTKYEPTDHAEIEHDASSLLFLPAQKSPRLYGQSLGGALESVVGKAYLSILRAEIPCKRSKESRFFPVVWLSTPKTGGVLSSWRS